MQAAEKLVTEPADFLRPVPNRWPARPNPYEPRTAAGNPVCVGKKAAVTDADVKTHPSPHEGVP